ncbi:hypothetical protein [Dethiosulfatarculus sandiegensis]|uniref:Tail fiber protein n=1 Tax=Dethiosulfatarculus sandiegensis TaxID=1429043 RepID=A0A0D2GHR3_9BACT|nr:hypothetical protein [Dethiosulfatarculus sandiegensis]KIX14412.1 hypothetical protein X474_09715 [Dethiosulfatarculus sandiegensis]
MHRIDGSGHQDNRFTEGNPQTGTEATVVTAGWLNAVQEEVAHVIEGQGLVLNKDDNEQLKTAVNTAIDQAVASCKTEVEQERDTAIDSAKTEMNGVIDQKIDASVGAIKQKHIMRWFAKGRLQTGSRVIKMMSGVNGAIKKINGYLWSGSANVSFEVNTSLFMTAGFTASSLTSLPCNRPVSPGQMVYITINSVSGDPCDFTGCLEIEED